MSKGLERDLGLYATVTISVGAMIGSGIFVLPGLAFKISGPSVITAYLLAGLIALPAVLSKAEMATAMPEAGGTYLYIDRAMGPFLGTIAGVGAWFSLTFKSAFALVGLGAYLVLFSTVPAKPVAIVLALLLLAVNVVGVKQSGRLQSIIVTVVVGILVLFIANGITHVESARYHPFLLEGPDGLLASTGFVFVSYAGVTKIASVAEEIEDPSRTIPIAMIGSVLLMMLVYTFAIFVVVGVSPPAELSAPDMLTPMALAADQFLGPIGLVLIAGTAVVALTSMANAGILSASRFPFAMSRDRLAPPSIEFVHGRFHTPVVALLLTGAVLVVLIGFVPVLELAKLASAFKILVFSLVNIALIAFRESEIDSYDPDFVTPGYPWVQLFGILGGLVLLTQMGALPMAGAVFLILLGTVWYRLYGREKTEREGAALDAIRRTWTDRALERTRVSCDLGGPDRVLVPMGRPPSPDQREGFLDVIRLGADIVRPESGQIRVVHFEEVPEQLDLQAAVDQSPADVEFEAGSELLADLDVDVEFGEIVTHDAKRSVANFVEHYDIDLVLGEWHPSRWHAELLGADVDWYMQHTTRDLVFIRNRGYADVGSITLIADRGPFDPLEVVVADAIAQVQAASIRLVASLAPSASADQREATQEYLDELAGFCRAETETEVLTAADQIGGLVEASGASDLVVVGTSAHHLFYDVLFGSIPDRLVERLDTTVLLTHTGRSRRYTSLKAILDRLVF